MRGALAIFLVGCGRVGFDPLGTSPEPPPVDAPPNAQTLITDVVADTYISTAGSSDANFGASLTLVVNDAPARRPLLRFDLSTLPSTAAVFSVDLIIAADATTKPDANPAQVRVLREAWDEGTADGQTGAASWLQRQTGVAWTTAGADVPSSDVAPIATFTVTGAGRYEIPLDRTVVAAWLADPASNAGVLIRCACSMSLVSREAPPFADNAKLRVVYVP